MPSMLRNWHLTIQQEELFLKIPLWMNLYMSWEAEQWALSYAEVANQAQMHWDLKWPSAPAEPINQIPCQSSQSTLQLMGWNTMQSTLGGGKVVWTGWWLWMTSPLSSVPLTPMQILSAWPRVTCTMCMFFSVPHLHFWVHTQAIFGSCGLLCTLVFLILS